MFQKIVTYSQIFKPTTFKRPSLSVLNSSLCVRTMAVDSDANRNVMWIRHVEEEPRLNGMFIYKSHKERSFNMNRLVSEPVGETFKRMKVNIAKHFYWKSEKKAGKFTEDINEVAETHVHIKLFDADGIQVDESKSNKDAWAQGGRLQINNCHYTVEINPPAVECLGIPTVLLSGYMLKPNLSVAFAELSDCEFSWLRSQNENADWTVVGSTEIYIPSTEDVGCKLKLIVVPKDGDRLGHPKEVISQFRVKEGPTRSPIIDRQKFTALYAQANSFRIVSYNILAAVYTESDFSRTQLFPHCPISYIDYDYRKQLIVQELLGYKADVICLQELDGKHFHEYYKPILSQFGYEGINLLKRHQKVPEELHVAVDGSEEMEVDEAHTTMPPAVSAANTDGNNRLINVREGSGIFFRSCKFREIGRHNLSIADSIDTDLAFQDIFEKVQTSDMVMRKLIYHSGASLQVVILESVDDPSNRVCICTTHLYFHPIADLVRLLQTTICVRHLQRIKNQYESKTHKLAVVFCGDFNSKPDKQVVRFMLNRFINKTDGVFTEYDMYCMSGLDLRHDMDLASACGFPKYTNYVPAFKECIDYIFFEKDHLFVESVTPVPPEEVLTAQSGGIPNEHFPSDHIPLICDLKWK